MNSKEKFPLSMAEKGRLCRVISMKNTGALRRRLRDLGLTEGTLTEKVFSGAFGDPSAYAFRGAVIALRKNDAADIIVEYE